MALQNINRGTTPNDGQGDTARAGALKINENFAYLLNAEATFKTIIGPQVSLTNVSGDVAGEINTEAPFTFEFANLSFIKYVEFVNGDIFNIYFFKLTEIGGGTKTFGNGGNTTLGATNLFLTGQKLKSVQDFQELNSTVTEDFGDIGTTSLIDYVNGISPAITIQATSIGATILKAIVNNTAESFLFKGDAGDYGSGELQLVDDDLESLNETTNLSVPIDTILSSTSSNPVENRVVKAALDTKQATKENKTVTASSYILLATDVDKFLIFSNACTVVVPNGLPANLEFQGKQGGTGQVTFSAESGGTLNVPSVFLAETAEQHCFFGIRTEGSDVSALFGDLKLIEIPNSSFPIPFKTLASPANEIDFAGDNLELYNWVAPTDEISFTLTNLRPGVQRIIRVQNATAVGSEILINGDGSASFIGSTDNWFTNEIMEISIFGLSTTEYEWWYNTKQR